MDNVKAVIFDLDGTLIDSMGIWAQIDEEYLDSFGHAVPENLQEEITHLTLTDTANYFKEKFNIEDTYFDAISTNKEVKKSKDNPDIYLLSAKKLNITPEECLVFEDIVQAVKGAKLAGMKVYAIHDKSSAHQRDELITLADRYICNYKELL